MMKKKGKTYILLIVVFGIWGAIGYQIFSKLSPDDSPMIATNSDISFTPKQAIEKDTFSINSEHRDPFLGKPYQLKQTSTTKKRVLKKKDPIVFPPIVLRIHIVFVQVPPIY